MTKKITIIIVTHNSRTKLPDCLASLYRQDYPSGLMKIIVIDNNSSDSTVGYIQENYPQVKLIQNKSNFGFVGANNQGYYLAQKNQADYLFLANDDIILETHCLSHLVKIMAQDSKIAAVQAKLLLYPQKNLINSFGNSIHYLGFAFCNYYKHQDNLGLVDPLEIAYASGAACLINMSALDKTGLFDDRLFMYHEDVDLGWRLRLAGYKIILDPLSVAYHKYHYSKAKYKFYYMDRNRFVVLCQNYRLLTIVLILPILVFMELGIIIFSIKNGWFREKIKGYLWILGHLPSILSQRIKTQFKIRRVPDREVVKFFVSDIKFQEVDNWLLTFIINPLMRLYWFIIKRLIIW